MLDGTAIVELSTAPAGLAAFGLAASLAALATFWLTRRGGLRADVPNERSSHAVATPRGGGVGFVLVIGVLCAFFLPRSATALGLGVGYLVIGVIGALEDGNGVPARWRFLVEACVALGVAFCGLRWQTLDFGVLSIDLPMWASYAFTVLWIVWVINLYNFMDGINGIAALNGVVASLIAVWIGGRVGVSSLFLLVVAGALLGFLPFNFPRAKIFMGDVGSLVLGYVVAVTALAFHAAGPARFSFLAGVLFVGPFFCDATWTLCRRILRFERVFEAHRTHFYQRLALRLGSHTPVTFGYAVLAALSGVIAAFL